MAQAFDHTFFGAEYAQTLTDDTETSNLIYGGGGNDTLIGGAGGEVLDGGSGSDAMVGGAGDDTYVVDDVGDTVIELSEEGTDTVQSSISYSLADKDTLENLTLTGSDAIDATGNALGNYISGNDANNVLSGEAGNDFLAGGLGNDILYGGDGDDTLSGGASNIDPMHEPDTVQGDDVMYGGEGNDIYMVSSADDIVVEFEGQGTEDRVESLVTYTLTANVEVLDLQGQDINGTGNGLDNTIQGSSGNNVLMGLGGHDYLLAGAGNDTLFGGEGEDSIFGGDGDDILDGGVEADALWGNAGDDTYIVSDQGDEVVELPDEGTDTVKSSITYSLVGSDAVENLTLTGSDATDATGNALNNVIIGNDGNNVLSGLDGNDTLDGAMGADTMIGGWGDDVYGVDDLGDVVTELPEEGTDTVQSSVTYSLADMDAVENLTLIGSRAIDATGNAVNNVIIGNDANNSLSGLDGNDTLDGGAGIDTLIGGTGDDTYLVDSLSDEITEFSGEGTDTVQSVITFSLADKDTLENLTLIGSDAIDATGNALSNVINGNDANNALSGLDGNDTLDGGAGIDTLIGGTGDDTYLVDSLSDEITEFSGEGTDTVQSVITFSLADKDSLENLTLIGSDAIDATGNALNNVITGNDTNNALSGEAGDDALYGGFGQDTLYGGDGNDTLDGGWGDDFFVITDSTDAIDEGIDQGTDTVQSSITYSLADKDTLENLTLMGPDAIDGTGNALNNVITGNDGGNLLSGLDGNDTLEGGGGIDTLIGGLGDDTYVVDSLSDDIIEFAEGGTDTVQSSITYSLVDKDTLENLTLTGSDAIDGTGNALDNVIIGSDGNNVLWGEAGDDTLRGGWGDDVYVITDSDADDHIEETQYQGTDTVRSSITYSLADAVNLENLTLTGVGALNGTGNTQDNLILGNVGQNLLKGLEGNDTLEGGAGIDTLIGGTGDDTYVVDDPKDDLTELASEGIDTVKSAFTYTLATHFENLTLTGDGDIIGTGNKAANAITGNSGRNTLYGGDGNDTLDGSEGNDTMAGGVGNDTYIVDNADDQIIEGAGKGVDGVESGVTYTLTSENLENLLLTGRNDVNGTGNKLANTITGNDAHNALSGLTGSDTLYGELGDDTLYGGIGLDVVFGGEGNDQLYGGGGIDTLFGGAGNDVYFVDGVYDTVSEDTSSDVDSVFASVSFALADNVENLTLTGIGQLKGTGNDLDNILTGNSGKNVLIGNDGADTLTSADGDDALYGGAGVDLLDGGAGIDRAVGGVDNDTYIVDNTKDSVVEKADEGIDLVKSSASYTLLANIEALELTGEGAINGTGNSLGNTINGNAADNILSGLSGNDILLGGDGNDKLVGGAGNDILTGGAGSDSFVFDKTIGSDNITDFTIGSDHIHLATALANLLGGKNALTEASFYAAADAVSSQDANDRLIYNTTTGALYYDADGIGKKAAVQIAMLDLVEGTVPSLQFSDFTFG